MAHIYKWDRKLVPWKTGHWLPFPFSQGVCPSIHTKEHSLASSTSNSWGRVRGANSDATGDLYFRGGVHITWRHSKTFRGTWRLIFKSWFICCFGDCSPTLSCPPFPTPPHLGFTVLSSWIRGTYYHTWLQDSNFSISSFADIFGKQNYSWK